MTNVDTLNLFPKKKIFKFLVDFELKNNQGKTKGSLATSLGMKQPIFSNCYSVRSKRNPTDTQLFNLMSIVGAEVCIKLNGDCNVIIKNTEYTMV
jgi:hypothetical protein